MKPDPMCKFSVLFTGAALLLAAGAVTSAAAATPSVVIQAPAPAAGVRPDVTTVCPSLQAVLGESLQEAWEHVQEAGTVQVQFQLDGDRLSQVQASEGSRRYHRFVKAAVKRLPCQSDQAAPQRFRFSVAFVEG